MRILGAACARGVLPRSPAADAQTTLAVALAKKLNLPVYFEPVIDNAYLADFYKDMARYSFPLQVYLLNRRFAQQQQIIWSGKGGVQDRTIYEDAVFAKVGGVVFGVSAFIVSNGFRVHLALWRAP